VFDGRNGKQTLADLFAGRSQLVVQHFMFAPDWSEGCKSCSFWADGFERMIPHLAARDTTLVAISRAPLQKLDAFKARMGWTFDWLSSANNDFNYDYAVSFTPEQIKSGAKVYNFGTSGFSVEEAPGISVFYLPHLFLLRARPRHDERCLPLPRPDAARPSRRGPAVPDGLAAAARPVSAGAERRRPLPDIIHNRARRCLRNRRNAHVLRRWIYRRGAEEEPGGLPPHGEEGR
jgi:peroxiredoxin